MSPLSFIAAVALAAGPAMGFQYFSPGDKLPEKTLPKLVGSGSQPYLAKSKVTVFFFFAPGTRNGQHALHGLAALEKEFAGRPVTWVPIVSGSSAAADAQKDVKEAGLAATILKDDGDELYGTLGTAMTPTVGVVDEQHKLLAYLPFTKLQFQDHIQAWVRFGLGELDQAGLDLVLKPPPLVVSGEKEVALRILKMAQKQRERGNLEGALASVKKAEEKLAGLPETKAMQAAILADQGKCPEALALVAEVLKVDAKNDHALETKLQCAAGSEAAKAPKPVEDAGAVAEAEARADGGTTAEAEADAGAPSVDAGAPTASPDAGPATKSRKR